MFGMPDMMGRPVGWFSGARRRRVQHTYWYSPTVGTQEVQTAEAGRLRENEELRLAGEEAGESTSCPERRCA